MMRMQARREARRSGAASTPPVGPPNAASEYEGPWGAHTSQRGAQASRRCGGARHWNHIDQEVDQALKEAIRRSMMDLQEQKEVVDVEEEKKVPAPKAEEASSPEATAPVTVEEKKETVEEKKETVEEKKETVEENQEASETATEIKPDEEEEFTIPPAPVGAPPAPRPMEEVKADKSLGDEADTEDSFTIDAQGNGDVAEALGETMDKIVREINDMSAELVRNSSENESGEEKVDVVTEESTKDGGATILRGEEENNDDSDDSEIHYDDISQNSWDVVSSDQLATDDADQLATDEALARAAQVIGSALFESELSRAGSQPNSSGSVSMLGSEHSVPSTLPSVVSEKPGSVQPNQFDRWALQLKQLHELGFLNDEKNVEIMERIHAANIGSGEMEEVSVERVVNEIMKEF